MPGQGNFGPQLAMIIGRFRQYLVRTGENRDFFPGVSSDSQQIMAGWGRRSESRPADPGPDSTVREPRPESSHGSAAPPFFSEGPENAAVYIVDSGAGFFKGQSGELLNKILSAMTLSRDNVLICGADNLAALETLVKTHRPKAIVALGSRAARALEGSGRPLDAIQGQFFSFAGTRAMPTYHPSLLLKAPEYKRQVWESMKQVMAAAGL